MPEGVPAEVGQSGILFQAVQEPRGAGEITGTGEGKWKIEYTKRSCSVLKPLWCVALKPYRYWQEKRCTRPWHLGG